MSSKRIAVLAVMMLFAFGTMIAYAADKDGYELTVYSGNGMFGSDDVLTGTSAKADPDKGTVSIDGGDPVAVTMPDKKGAKSSKYFVLGLKLTGHDNEEYIAGTVDVTSESSIVHDEDASVIVAYGLKSNMTKYTIEYVSAATGEALAKAETHYGVTGGKPIISYKYIEGYLPNAWNETGRIAADGSTTFTFYYYEVDSEGNVITINDGTTNTGGNANANAGGNANAGAGGNAAAGNAPAGTAIGDNATPLADGPQDLVDIDDNAAPLANGEDEGAGMNKGLIAGIAAALAAIAAACAFLVRRRNLVDEEEE